MLPLPAAAAAALPGAAALGGAKACLLGAFTLGLLVARAPAAAAAACEPSPAAAEPWKRVLVGEANSEGCIKLRHSAGGVPAAGISASSVPGWDSKAAAG